jgi:hypothetical protein
MNKQLQRPGIRGKQRGAALFMALIFLLILTILGVFGLNISRLENLMAGNNQFQTTALNNAELILSIGEQKLRSILGNVPFTEWNDPGDHYYDRTSESTNVIDTAVLNWTFPFGYDDNPLNSSSDPNAHDSRFVIEYTGAEIVPGNDSSLENTSACIAGSCVWVFLVTTQNEASRGAKRTVQSVYVTGTPP